MRAFLFAAFISFASLTTAGPAMAVPVGHDGLVPDDTKALVLDVKRGWGGGHHGRGWGVGGRPPGWGHGRKRGWRGYGMPPGQYRKRHRGYYYGGPVYYGPRFF